MKEVVAQFRDDKEFEKMKLTYKMLGDVGKGSIISQISFEEFVGDMAVKGTAGLVNRLNEVMGHVMTQLNETFGCEMLDELAKNIDEPEDRKKNYFSNIKKMCEEYKETDEKTK